MTRITRLARLGRKFKRPNIQKKYTRIRGEPAEVFILWKLWYHTLGPQRFTSLVDNQQRGKKRNFPPQFEPEMWSDELLASAYKHPKASLTLQVDRCLEPKERTRASQNFSSLIHKLSGELFLGPNLSDAWNWSVALYGLGCAHLIPWNYRAFGGIRQQGRLHFLLTSLQSLS